MWRWWDRTERAEAILTLIRQYYTPDGEPRFSATFPLFASWSRQSDDGADDSVERGDSNVEDDDDEVEEQSDATSGNVQQRSPVPLPAARKPARQYRAPIEIETSPAKIELGRK